MFSTRQKRERERSIFSPFFPHNTHKEWKDRQLNMNTILSTRLDRDTDNNEQYRHSNLPCQIPSFSHLQSRASSEREENVGGGFPLSRLFTSSENNNRETRSLRNVVSLTLCPFPFLFVCHSLLFSLSVLCHLFCYWGNYSIYSFIPLYSSLIPYLYLSLNLG